MQRDDLLAEGWVFLVLTLDRHGTRGGKPWTDERSAYQALGGMSERFLKRVRRLCVGRGWDAPGSEWALVVEAHRSGWPHANLLIYAPALADALAEESSARAMAGFIGREVSVLAHRSELLGGGIRGELGEHAVACGWGIESTAERVRSREAMAGYLVKLAGSPALGELAKLSQLPTNAPFRFRRLRSGKGFLPPVQRGSNEWTGALVKRDLDDRGLRWPVVPRPKNGHAKDRVSVVCEVEELELECLRLEELEVLARVRGRPVPATVPPISSWLGRVLQRQQAPPPPDDAGWAAATAYCQLLLMADSKAA